VLHGAKLNRQLGMYFKFFLLYGFPEDTVEDHRLTEELIAETRPDAVCCAILQPIPGTAVYEQLKPYLTKDVAEMDFHYWHSTESFKHPTFTHEELHRERDRLLVAHVKATKGIECRKDADVIDETPMAYKDIDAVMEAQSDLVEVVHTLKQVVCVKG